jgi:hypothetical protein
VIVTVSAGSVEVGAVRVTVFVTVSGSSADLSLLHPTDRPARARIPAASVASVRLMRRILSRALNAFVTAL